MIPSTHKKSNTVSAYYGSHIHRTVVFLLIFSLLFGDFQSIYLGVPRAQADTGAKYPGSQAAVASGAGDNNGFQTNASTHVMFNDDGYASDASTGTGNATDGCGTFNQAEDDAHDFYDFNFNIPSWATAISGITVETQSYWDSATGVNQLCFELSWDGGTSWTATGNTTGDISTTLTTSILGGATSTWGRTWATSEFSNANFRLRVMVDPGASNARTANLDYLTVNVVYTSASVSGTVYTDEGVTALNSAGKTLKLRVGTGTPSILSTTTLASTGYFEFQGVTGLAPGIPMSLWVDGDSSFRAFSFTKASSTSQNITGLDLYKNRVIVKHEAPSGTTTSNVELGLYDGDDDAAPPSGQGATGTATP